MGGRVEMSLDGEEVGTHGVMRLSVLFAEASEEARKSHFFMESGGGTPGIDPGAEHTNCIVGTEPTEEFACRG